MLRLECVKCKTKLQLALKRCKHFELGYVDADDDTNTERILTAATVVTRRRRVRLWCSKCVVFRSYQFLCFSLRHTGIMELGEGGGYWSLFRGQRLIGNE